MAPTSAAVRQRISLSPSPGRAAEMSGRNPNIGSPLRLRRAWLKGRAWNTPVARTVGPMPARRCILHRVVWLCPFTTPDPSRAGMTQPFALHHGSGGTAVPVLLRGETSLETWPESKVKSAATRSEPWRAPTPAAAAVLRWIRNWSYWGTGLPAPGVVLHSHAALATLRPARFEGDTHLRPTTPAPQATL